ncbi:hypothetical protein GGF46_002659 [Coemansia sp. RSA 552]|nr:hypothetical protein GGF46_002659 [Coemansia sp. RSA 552]
MDYFKALQTSHDASPERTHSPLPLPQDKKDVGAAISYIQHTCNDLYFSSDSDEPVELYQLSNTGLKALESDIDKLALPSARDFAVFVAGEHVMGEEGFVAEKKDVRGFFDRLTKQQITERQRQLAQSLEALFGSLATGPGTTSACYRVGIAPNIEVYVVMLVDGQVIGIKTLSVET